MDRPLEETISDRQKASTRGGRGRGRRQNEWAHSDAKKWISKSDVTDIDNDWVHDKYEDDPHTRKPYRLNPRDTRLDRYSPETSSLSPEARLRVDNLHYDLTEDDLDDLFNRIAPVTSLSIRFDRAGRSSGTAFVTYASISAANRAIREYDGANAAGQPIRLTLLPTAPANNSVRGRATAALRNPFDTAIKPGRSLFDRVEKPNGRHQGGRSRSRSPGATRRTNISKPPPEGVDRYVPSSSGGSRRSRSRSPRWGGRGGRGRDREDRGGDGDRSHRMVNGRPRKTQEELDKEMEDYWISTESANGEQKAHGAAASTTDDGDIEMIA